MIGLRRFPDQGGSSIVTAMFVSFALLSLVALLYAQIVHSEETTGQDRGRATAFHIAEAGVDEAIAHLSSRPSFAGSMSGPVTADGSTLGAFTSTILDPGPGVTNDRVITSTGTLAAGSQTRTIKQVVRLVPVAGFEYALFSATTTTFREHASIVGNTYSTNPTTLVNHTTITGNVISPADITTATNTTINGDVWSGGNVVVSGGTAVTGNVLASGSATISSGAKVTGDVRAASITNNGTILGQQVTSSQPSPLARTLPAFTYNPLNYPAPVGPPVETTTATFSACWSSGVGCPLGVSRTAMRGVYRITDGGTLIAPIQKTTLNGDLFIITNGRVVLQRDFATASSATYRLVVISLSASDDPPAVSWTNNVSTPPNVQTLIFAAGTVAFSQLKSFSGVVYANKVLTDNNFTLSYEPALKTSVAGFEWDLSSARSYEIRPLTWKECPSPVSC